jgi:hypothetical protein
MSDDELSRLQELLDRATSPAANELNLLDREAASLRSGWLGLCRLIQEEQRTGEPAKRNVTELVRRLDRHSLSNSPARRATWIVWVTVAIAASVLLAVSVATIVKRFGGRQIAPVDGQQVAQNERSADVRPSAAGDRGQWGDSVDDEITAVSRATLLAQDDWYAQSSRIGAVQSGLYDLENEMEQGKP